MGRPIDAHQANRCNHLFAIQEFESVIPTVTQPLLQLWAKVLSHDAQIFSNATRFKEHLLAMRADHFGVRGPDRAALQPVKRCTSL